MEGYGRPRARRQARRPGELQAHKTPTSLADKHAPCYAIPSGGAYARSQALPVPARPRRLRDKVHRDHAHTPLLCGGCGQPQREASAMTKNSGPKKRARAAAKALNVPLSEAKHQAGVRGREDLIADPKPLTLRVHRDHQGFIWDRERDSHALFGGMPGSGKTWLLGDISAQASRNGETIVYATVTADEILVTISGPDRDVSILEGHPALTELERELRAIEGRVDTPEWTRALVILDGFNYLPEAIKDLGIRLGQRGRSMGVTLIVANPAGQGLDEELQKCMTLSVSTGFEAEWENFAWEGQFGAPVSYRSQRDELLLTGRDLRVASLHPAPQQRLDPQQFRFDGKRTAWNVRGHARDGRFTLATCSQFGDVYYTVIDWAENVRGTVNVIGGGLGIETNSGADPAVIDALEMLEGSFEVSHRNRVPLVVSGRRVAGVWHELAGPAVA